MNITQRHDTRCNKCKSTIYSMLQKVYGNLEFKYKAAGISTRIEDYTSSKYYKYLQKIHISLESIHGYRSFVNSKTLQRCDLYVPKKKYIIETDELQHFTYPRFVSLQNYPRIITLGYDKKWYASTCDTVRNIDTDPKYRDEQRAWYDTIRDFLPLLTDDVSLTIRIPLGFHSWCSLSSKSAHDVKLFKNLALGFVL